MFSKFKKFAMMFVFCMSIFGVTAFADVVPLGDVSSHTIVLSTGQTLKFGSTDDSSITYRISGGQIYFYNNSNVNVYILVGSSGVSVSPGAYVTSSVYDGLKSFTIDDIYCGNTGSSPSGLFDGSTIIPPEVAPTVKEAIAKIVPDLSAQLKILLPVGVLILSTVLGVSLVRLLVPLFL